ncbi:MAG: hypothetical protein LUC91_11545, partial [Prevotella sp.]|nr:hypothetical protein [Prevotella sp.]
MTLLLLVMACAGAYAQSTQAAYITVTWPFSKGDVSVLSDYSITNTDNETYKTPEYTKEGNDIILITSPSTDDFISGDINSYNSFTSFYTRIDNGLSFGGTIDISEYTQYLSSWSESNSTFTKITSNGIIELVIMPNYPGYNFRAKGITFDAFKNSGGSSSINIRVNVKWGALTFGDCGYTMNLSPKELPTASGQLSESDYKYTNNCQENSWIDDGSQDIPYGHIAVLRLTISGLNDGDEIYLGNVTFSHSIIGGTSSSPSEATDKYQTTYNDNKVDDVSIVHKKAKWYQDNIRYDNGDYVFNDDFDDKNKMVALESGDSVQAAHVYVDTIYMKKGTSIDLMIPGVSDANGSDCTIKNYFRWFNYRNDMNFYCGEDNTVGKGENIRKDLLLPAYNVNNVTAWRFANGYVSGILSEKRSLHDYNDDSYLYSLRKVSFYYPTDNEFNQTLKGLDNFKYQNESSDENNNSYYAVACDLSNYTDFSNAPYVVNAGGNAFGLTNDANSEDGTPQIYCEPTLMQRVLFYIIGIEDTTTVAGLPEDFQYYGNLFNNTDYQGGTNAEGKKYFEEYEITFPSKRISNNTDELVALSKDARAYAIPVDSNPLASNLDIAFVDDDNGFTLSSTTLSGANRVIQFYKGSSKAQWSVDNNSTATILVTKTV